MLLFCACYCSVYMSVQEGNLFYFIFCYILISVTPSTSAIFFASLSLPYFFPLSLSAARKHNFLQKRLLYIYSEPSSLACQQISFTLSCLLRFRFDASPFPSTSLVRVYFFIVISICQDLNNVQFNLPQIFSFL